MRARVIVLIATLALPGCQQTVTSSTVVIGGDALSADERSDIVARVYALVAEMNGRCALLNPERAYHSCWFDDDRRYLLGVGNSLSGDYIISLRGDVVHWWPRGRDTVLSDKFLTDGQRKLETWLLSLPPAGTDYTAKRTYLGYPSLDGPGDFSKDL